MEEHTKEERDAAEDGGEEEGRMGHVGGLRSRDRRDGTQRMMEEQKEGCDTGGDGGAQGGRAERSEPGGGWDLRVTRGTRVGSQGSEGDTAGQAGTGEVWGAPASQDHHGAERSPRGVRGHGGPKGDGREATVVWLIWGQSAHRDGERMGHRVRAAGGDGVWGHPRPQATPRSPPQPAKVVPRAQVRVCRAFIHHTTSRHGTGCGWAPSSGQILPFMRPWGGHRDRGEDEGRGCRG